MGALHLLRYLGHLLLLNKYKKTSAFWHNTKDSFPNSVQKYTIKHTHTQKHAWDTKCWFSTQLEATPKSFNNKSFKKVSLKTKKNQNKNEHFSFNQGRFSWNSLTYGPIWGRGNSYNTPVGSYGMCMYSRQCGRTKAAVCVRELKAAFLYHHGLGKAELQLKCRAQTTITQQY